MSNPQVTFHIPRKRTPDRDAVVLKAGAEMLRLCNEEQSRRISFVQEEYHMPAAEKFEWRLVTCRFIVDDGPTGWGEFLTKKLAEEKA